MALPSPLPNNAGTDVLDDLYKQSNESENFLQLTSELSAMKCQGHPSNGTRYAAENVHGSSSKGWIIIDPTILIILRLKLNFVEWDVGMSSKIPPTRDYIQPRRHKSLQIRGNKLLIDRSQTYTLLSAWASCVGRNCQDNINTDVEIQRRQHTFLQSIRVLVDRLCGLVVRVSGYRYRGPGFDPRRYQIFWVIVGLERGSLSLVSLMRSIEELI